MASNADWTEVDVSELPVAVQEQYAHMKGIYRQYKAAKHEFEGRMQGLFADKMPRGSELKFGYNFGKLSIAIGEQRERKQAKAKVSLTEWLELQQA